MRALINTLSEKLIILSLLHVHFLVLINSIQEENIPMMFKSFIEVTPQS